MIGLDGHGNVRILTNGLAGTKIWVEGKMGDITTADISDDGEEYYQ